MRPLENRCVVKAITVTFPRISHLNNSTEFLDIQLLVFAYMRLIPSFVPPAAMAIIVFIHDSEHAYQIAVPPSGFRSSKAAARINAPLKLPSPLAAPATPPGYLNLGHKIPERYPQKAGNTRSAVAPPSRCGWAINGSIDNRCQPHKGGYKKATLLSFIPHRLFFLDHHLHRHLRG